MSEIAFWYEFASTYSYPAAMRIEALAAARGIAVNWRPFLLGPLFAEQGWRDSPFNIFPVKGRYMWRDMERICARLGLPLVRPQPFPQPSVLAARLALAVADEDRPAFSRAVYRSEFGEGRPIGEAKDLLPLLRKMGLDADALLVRAQSPAIKDLLRQQTSEASTIGLPGAPCLVCPDGELFWGNDRLEEGLDWVSRTAG